MQSLSRQHFPRCVMPHDKLLSTTPFHRVRKDVHGVLDAEYLHIKAPKTLLGHGQTVQDLPVFNEKSFVFERGVELNTLFEP